MTKFDIRLRRKRFTQGRIERHKNFQNLMGNYDRSSRKKTRGVMVLVILLILIIAILLAFFGTIEEKKQESPKEQVGFNTIFEHSENIENKTVYILKK
ncbi:MAG: hypothetical protein KAQ79_12630 [Cyclobacteriaceae bacterium]|nr:hypothetical protein [Cyclobacteriaceae bacterium]